MSVSSFQTNLISAIIPIKKFISKEIKGGIFKKRMTDLLALKLEIDINVYFGLIICLNYPTCHYMYYIINLNTNVYMLIVHNYYN